MPAGLAGWVLPGGSLSSLVMKMRREVRGEGWRDNTQHESHQLTINCWPVHVHRREREREKNANSQHWDELERQQEELIIAVSRW